MSVIVGPPGGGSVVQVSGSFEQWADRAEARINDAGLVLSRDGKVALRSIVAEGFQRAEQKGVGHDDLAQSLDRTIERFADSRGAREAPVVDGRLLEQLWQIFCIYPWCRGHR